VLVAVVEVVADFVRVWVLVDELDVVAVFVRVLVLVAVDVRVAVPEVEAV